MVLTTPLSTAWMTNGCPGTTVVTAVPEPSSVPVAFGPSYCAIVNVSFPTGATNGTVHARPPAVVVQFGELLLMSATVGAPPFAAIETDTAESEMYFGVRAADAGAGCEIVRTSFPATRALADGVLGALAPPPPHAASDKAPIRKDPARRRCIGPSQKAGSALFTSMAASPSVEA